MSGPRNVSAHLATGCRFEERAGNGTWNTHTHTHSRTQTFYQQAWNRLCVPLSTLTLLSDVVSSHSSCQVWHIGEPLRGNTRCWCDVCPPKPCCGSHGCCLPPRGIFYFLSVGYTPTLSCWLLSPHSELSVISTPTQFFEFNAMLGVCFFFLITQLLPTRPHTESVIHVTIRVWFPVASCVVYSDKV